MKTTTLLIGLSIAVASTANAQLFPGRDPADINGDGAINGADLAILLGKWGPAPPPWAVVLELCPDPMVVTDPKLREAIIATGLPWRVQDIGTGIEMLLVPPGTFMMGCSPSLQYGCNANENPVHEVTLTQAFYLGRYEVTQAQWTAVTGSNPSGFQGFDDSPSRPVERTSWTMIQGFLGVTGLRLPTEAEWEYACRGGTDTAYNNGSNDAGTAGDVAWFAGNNLPVGTKPVGQKAANPLGFHDMHGNVWEWTNDWFGAYPTTAMIDPSGPSTGPYRVIRGGDWGESAGNLRSSRRNNFFPVGDDSDGFRAARTP